MDDLNIFTPMNSGVMKQIKEKLAATFEMVDMRPLAFYMGLKITSCNCKPKSIKLSQLGYIQKFLNQYYILITKTVKTLM